MSTAAAEVPTTSDACTSAEMSAAATEMATTAAYMATATPAMATAAAAMTPATTAAPSSRVSRARKDGGQDNNGTEFEF